MKIYVCCLIAGIFAGAISTYTWELLNCPVPKAPAVVAVYDRYLRAYQELSYMYTYEDEIIRDGDVPKYSDLLSMEMADRIPYIILMAHHYNRPEAYYDFYRYFFLKIVNNNFNINTTSKERIDTASIKLTLDFINKGVQLEDKGCVRALSNLLQEGRYIKRDTILAESLRTKAKSLKNWYEK